MKNTIKQIEQAYGLSIKSFTPAPRGYWAETYIINTDNNRYFMKIHKNFPWEAELRASIDIQYQMAEHIDYIAKPIKTKNNTLLHTLDDNWVVSIYSYIDGTSYITNNPCEAMGLMANIYKLNIKCDNKYVYKFYTEKIMDEIQADKYESKSDPLMDYVKRNRKVYTGYWNRYVELVNKVRSTNTDKNLYLTHGDLAKNLMIDSNKKVFIIDWDRIRLGPIELDLNEFIDKNTDIKAVENIAKNAGIDWSFDKDYHNYFILNDLYYYLRNLLNTDHSKITADSLYGYQAYIDKLSIRLLE